MTWRDVHPDAIPDPLRRLSWVVWRAEPRGESKPAKVPYRIADPDQRASSTDPATWGTFADAVEAYSALVGQPHPRGPVAGIGVVLLQVARVTCVDLDGVLDGDVLDPRAARLVARLSTWTEISPSGRGLHLWVRGAVPRALVGAQFECYSTGRYIAVTGDRWPGTPDTLADAQETLDHWVWLDNPAAATIRVTGTGPPTTVPVDDLAGMLLARLAGWRVAHGPVKAWGDGFLVELVTCPWTSAHTSGPGGAAVIVHASGALDFRCLHSHCADRRWREFRAAMEGVTP